MSEDLTPQSGLEQRFRFSRTVTLGDVMTIVTFLIAGMSFYFTLEKRVSLLETEKQYQSQRQAEKESSLKETLLDLKLDVKTLQASVNDIRNTQQLRAK